MTDTPQGPVVEGGLDIEWSNRGNSSATPKYKVIFLPYADVKDGAQPSRTFVGDDAFADFLNIMQSNRSEESRRAFAESLLARVRSDGFVSLENVILPQSISDFLRAI